MTIDRTPDEWKPQVDGALHRPGGHADPDNALDLVTLARGVLCEDRHYLWGNVVIALNSQAYEVLRLRDELVKQEARTARALALLGEALTTIDRLTGDKG